MFAAHLWNHAKTAWMIAAFGNFYVSKMRRCEPETRRIVIGNVSGPRFCECEIDIVAVGINVQRPTSNLQRRSVRVRRSVFGVRRWTFSQNLLHNRSKLTHLIQSNKRIYLRHLPA